MKKVKVPLVKQAKQKGMTLAKALAQLMPMSKPKPQFLTKKKNAPKAY